ncbi:MAG: zinc-ribbon domain-containing protein, partial [Clostridia bacterium]|nr:zinc-ribbon domain-containing protein [Clostridia bacterium]
MSKCTNCGNEFDGNFCPNCGTKATTQVFCQNCGTKLPVGTNFCPNCG